MTQTKKTRDLLEHLTADLGVINEIQQGLAKRLDFQSIIDLVGDKLSSVLRTDNLGIWWYDENASLLHFLYDFEHGKRLFRKPVAISQESAPHEPVIRNTSSEGLAAGHVPGTDIAKSSVTIPIIVKDRVIGAIHDENFEREYAYGESELRLLTTIAGSLGIALENALLFDETQRLLKETSQRNAELAIINEIQLGLASKLVMQEIYDLVCSKIRQIFAADVVGFILYDESTGISTVPYMFDHGERFYPPAQPINHKLLRRLKTNKPIVIGTFEDAKRFMTKYGLTNIGGPTPDNSYLMMPIMTGTKVTGGISIAKLIPHAFSDADVRLLKTLVNSMKVALENASLFDETQHLYKEEQARVAELEIINSIQQGLAKELDFQSIIDLVGDKLKEVLHTGDLGIMWHDEKTNLNNYLYAYEHGKRLTIGPLQPVPGGVFEQISRTRQPMIANTSTEFDEVTEHIEGTDYAKSAIAVPIISSDRVLGLITVENYEREYAFKESEQRLLTTIAASLGTALENARLFNETQRLFKAEQEHVNELQIINSIQQGLASELDFQAIIDLVGDKLREVLHTSDLGIRWYDEQTNLLHYLYNLEHGQRISIISFPPTPGGIFEQVRKSRKPLIGNTTEEINKYSRVIPGTDMCKSNITVPIISSDKVLGLITIESYEREYAFNESDQRLLTTIAASLGTALENARLFAETQRLFKSEQERVAELQIINSIQQGLAAELDFKAIVDLVGDRLREVFHSEDIAIRWLDEQTGLVHHLYEYEHGIRLSIEPTPPRPGSFFDKNTKNHKAIIWNTAEEGDELTGGVVPGTDRSLAGVMIPISSGDRILGSVQLENYLMERAFGEAEIRLLTTIAASLGSALENARLFDETQRLLKETEQRNAELAIINSVQAALAAELDIQGIYDAVGNKIREIFHSDNLEIRIFDPNSNLELFPYLYEKGQRMDQAPLERIESGFSAYVARTHETLVINQNMTEAMQKFGSYHVSGTIAKSAAYVPLIVGDQVRGLVALSDFEEEHAFSESDIRLLQTLVNSMSVALENARLFNETQRLLEETSQRATELSIINLVSQSMSSQLQVESIVHTVGDQIRDTLHSEVVNIYLYDTTSKMIHLPYSWDRRYVETEAFAYGSGLTSKILDTKQPLILGNFKDIVATGALLSQNAPNDELMPQSYLGVPIIVGDKAIGAIDVQSYTQFVYNDSHVRLLTTLAASMGVALENARLFEETRRLLAETEQRNRELAIISSIGQALAGQLDPQGIYELVGEKLRQVFDAQVVAIITYDRQEDLLHYRYLIEKGERSKVEPRPRGGMAGHILKTRQPLLITHDLDTRSAEYGSKIVTGESSKSYIGVPLIAGGEATGIITLQNIDREDAFNENDLRLLSTLALNMGVALENARLYQETQHHAVEMAALAEIGSDIASTHEMEPVLERLAAKTRELMEVRDIALYLIQPDGHTLKAIVSQGKYAQETKNMIVTLGQGITGSIAQTGVAEIVNDPGHDSRTILIPGTPSIEEEPEVFMVAPLISRSKVIGVMSVYRDHNQGLFTQLELDFLISLARQAAIAIESARLYAETERRATEMAALAEVGREISATLELQVVLERIVGQARELLVAENSAVYLLQADGLSIKAIAAEGDIAPQVMADGGVQVGVGIIGNIMKNGAAEWVNDTLADPRVQHIPGTAEAVHGEKLLAAPLLVKDYAIGALAAWREPADPEFNQSELSFAVGLAQQAAVAIENARLFESAQESQRRMADIIDFLPDSTFVVDSAGKVIAWNHAMEEMTGIKADKILGMGDHEYSLPFYGERRPILIDMVLQPDVAVEKNYTQIQHNEGVLVGEAITTLKGKKTYLNATASALKNSRGEVVGAIESIRDITDQKLAEQELEQAKLEAEQANQAKSAFLAMMSHEIRTPMNAIIGMSGLLMDTNLNPDQREFAETIRSSGDALLTIINDILDFSKIEAGKMTLEEAPFDLRECIEASLDLIKVRASEKGLELAYQMDSDVPPAIIGDVTRLRQVFINLLGNSVKFTEQGEIVLSASCGEQEGSLHFSVRDTGIGISPDRISMLFRPFTQADASTSRRYGGTGLGLALSSRIVDLMGGKIWVESEGIAGKGSTFHVDIIAKPVTDWKGRPHLLGEQEKLSGKRLLVVDDNATNLRILELQARTWGMVPVECSTPEQVLHVLRSGGRFDVAILDMQMPEMSGVELAAEIRKLEASQPDSPRLPLILSTSLGGREEARDAKDFTSILMKPIRQSALYDTLITLFVGQTSGTAKPAADRSVMDPEMGSRHPLRILLAEDNVVNQKLALRLLSQMGYRADIAANGLEVLQAVKRQTYDVILMDVQMPDMDGLEATRRLCAEMSDGRRPHIVAMTANAMQGDREMCLEAGMDDYLSKPIRVDELVNALYRTNPLSSD